MDYELKSCPFCGGSTYLFDFPDVDGMNYSIKCNSCCVTSALYDTEVEAVDAWNKRNSRVNIIEIMKLKDKICDSFEDCSKCPLNNEKCEHIGRDDVELVELCAAIDEYYKNKEVKCNE